MTSVTVLTTGLWCACVLYSQLLEGPEGIMGGSASADAGATTRGGGVGKPP